jgi:hypothetical protein
MAQSYYGGSALGKATWLFLPFLSVFFCLFVSQNAENRASTRTEPCDIPDAKPIETLPTPCRIEHSPS